MANIISGHISGNYGGPKTCDTAYGAGRSATSCATNAGDCSHTVVVGTTGVDASFPVANTIYPDSFAILTGRAYTGPVSCTTNNNSAFARTFAAIDFVGGSFYVNPGECVEITFRLYSRAYNDQTAFCQDAAILNISGATAPNLGILVGEWYPYNETLASCCSQINKLCEPEVDGNNHRAILTYKMFRDEMLSYMSDLNTFCCPEIGECAEGTKSVSPIYDPIYNDCIASYDRECYYSQNDDGCIGSTSDATNDVVADIIGPKYASYFYCADQPCGARISFGPGSIGINGSFEYYALTDAKTYIEIVGSVGCGTGCTES